ncbi:MAG: DNA polymerase ligase N-terminal domain-containing protein [Candidatus Bathyarchaeia archaeon]
MSLEEYRRKRDFTKTREPLGEERTGGVGDLVYVVQKHQATRLHYDLRLEMGGVLKSWAVPKEIPTTRNVKRLAVETEDHPIQYAGFEGEIPEGEYGAGTVEIWDNGSYNLVESSENKIVVDIRGKKIRGRYCLIRFRPNESPKNWLLFKLD